MSELAAGLASVGAATPSLSAGIVHAQVPPEPLFIRQLSKRFGEFTALDNVSCDLMPGRFHALLGENGAGKSTLVKCIMGFYQADGGSITLGSKELSLKSPRDAQLYGIGMVYQHFTLVENMTVAENLVLARATVPRVINWQREIAAIESFMDTMPFRVSARRTVRQLAAGEKQKLEILKQLYLGSRILILDEPTSVLTPQEADNVLGMVRQMTELGKLSAIMITHKFREVMAFADDVTVLRRGRLSGSGPTREHTPQSLAEMMMGSEAPEAALVREAFVPSQAILELTNVSAMDDMGAPVLEGVSLSVSPGEIVGIAGVSGNGQDELVEVLAGQRAKSGGQIKVQGEAYTGTRAEARKQQLRLLPEAPLRNACVANMSLTENIAFRCFDVPPHVVGGLLLSKGSMRRRTLAAIRDYRIKTPGPEAPIGDLSGGNVQRAVLARELSDDVSVLIAANPCFGLDFAAVSEIRLRLLRARNSGTAVLLVSADLDEIFALADRILVMSEGRIVHEALVRDASVTEIGRHMAGHSEVPQAS